MNNPTQSRNELLYRDAIFAPEIYMRENNMRETFHPSACHTMEVSDQIFHEISTDNAQIDKQMLIEGVHYYSGILFWINALQIKRENSVTLTNNEVRVLSLFSSTQLNIPESLYLYLRAFGKLDATSNGQTLILCSQFT